MMNCRWASEAQRVAGRYFAHRLGPGRIDEFGALGGHAAKALLQTLIEAQMATFLPSDTSRVEMTGPPVTLRPEPVHSIELAIHELATNASKHGALSGETGGVRIDWQLEEGRDLRLEWRDVAGWQVAAPVRSGFGRRVFERTVELSPGAKAIIDFHPDGLVFDVGNG